MSNVMRVALRTLALIVALPVLALLAAVAMNHRAEVAATELCSSIAVGSSAASAITRGQGVAKSHVPGPHAHQFWFQGWPHDGSICTVRVQDGKVTGTSVSGVKD